MFGEGMFPSTQDPFNIPVSSLAQLTRHLGITPSSVEDRFRPIRALARVMKTHYESSEIQGLSLLARPEGMLGLSPSRGKVFNWLVGDTVSSLTVAQIRT